MCSQVHILTNHCACCGQRLGIVQSKDKPSYVLMCLTTEMELTSKMLCFFKKLDDGQSLSKKRWLCQVTSIMLCSLFWVSWPLKTGPIGCPEMQVTNYLRVLYNIPEECRSYVSIWRWRPWFGWAWCGSERFSSAQFSSALHTRIWDNLTYLSAKGMEKIKLSCIGVNTVMIVFITNTELYLCLAAWHLWFHASWCTYENDQLDATVLDNGVPTQPWH
jgi:hypothetical protein